MTNTLCDSPSHTIKPFRLNRHSSVIICSATRNTFSGGEEKGGEIVIQKRYLLFSKKTLVCTPLQEFCFSEMRGSILIIRLLGVALVMISLTYIHFRKSVNPNLILSKMDLWSLILIPQVEFWRKKDSKLSI